MATNPQARVLELLKRFNDGKKVCIEALQNDPMWFGKSEKTIRRDLDVIKEYFPESFELIRGSKGEKGCYRAITKDTFNNFLNNDTLSLLIQTFNIAQRNNLLVNLNISEDDKRIIESKIRKVKNYYRFITKPYESKKADSNLLKQIEHAIEYKKYITITQKESKGTREYVVKPYRILFMNENFYLACENSDESHPFSMFRISNIITISLHSKTFHINPDILDFVENIQTPFSKYTSNFRQHLINVVVEVDREKAKFFKLKKFLSSQDTMETKENGNLLLSFKVTQEKEMEELIKKWLPYIKIIAPISLKQKIEEDCKKYINASCK